MRRRIRLFTIIIALLWAQPAHAQSRAVLYGGTVLDIASTQWGLSHGLHEANPALARHRSLTVALPLGTAIGADFVASKIHQPIIRYVVGAIHIVAGGYNISLIQNKR